MNAGRELDALVAEKVMGWKDRVIKTEPCYPSFDVTATPPNWGETGARYHRVPDYSTDIAAAWLVVSVFDRYSVCKNSAGEVAVELTRFNPRAYGVVWQDEKVQNAPLAICLAALKAIEEKA